MNNILENITNFVDTKITPPLVKFGSNKYMVAMRNALIRLIPLLIVGSFPMILTNLPIASLATMIAPYNDALNTLSNMTFGFIALFLAFGVGSEMADTYELDKTTVGIVSAACFLITVAPLDLSTNTISVGGFGASGMFTTFVIGIVCAEVIRFCEKHKLGIRMPDGVPEGIASSFSSIIPMTILFVFFWILRIILGFDLNAFLKSILSPILILSDTWYAVLIVGLVLMLCWSVGIHGGQMYETTAAINVLNKYKNIYIETSSMFKIRIENLVKKNLLNQVIFGSDTPVGDMELEMKKIDLVITNEEDREKVYSKNILSLLGGGF